jgi:DNA mismatch repair protein MutL
MSDIISVLPDAIANQIAAGEVVQRPASVVKELMENSVDAGATDIKLIIKDGGSTLLQVIDNGKGMSVTDARMCWERHATSKIRKADDLFRITSFGFRGEAMASIAAVAHVEMKTRRAEDELATYMLIEASEIKKHENVAAPVGTNISVRNLFFNIPARRNFLKSIPVETRHIIEEFIRVSMPNPGISFSFINNDNEVYNLRAGSPAQRIAALLGIKDPAQLLYDEEETDIMKTKVFLGQPQLAKKTRGDQFFFVNGRFIKSAYLHHAVTSAYDEMIAKDTHPAYVVFMDVPPEKIDINVHPTKTEIKFEDEKYLYQILKSVCRKALGQHLLLPGEDDGGQNNAFNRMISETAHNQRMPEEPKIKVNKGFNPFGGGETVRQKQNLGKWQDIFGPLVKEDESIPAQTLFAQEQLRHVPEDRPLEQVQNIFQYAAGYLVFTTEKGLFVADQQAAHERVLYEEYARAMDGSGFPSQQLLFPRVVEFHPLDFALLEEILDQVKLLGFDINPFGKNTFIVNGTPADLKKGDPKQMLEGVLQKYKDNLQGLKLSQREALMRAMARQAAVARGTILTPKEVTELANQLMNCEVPAYTPAGKPVFITFAPPDLAKRFE